MVAPATTTTATATAAAAVLLLLLAPLPATFAASQVPWQQPPDPPSAPALSSSSSSSPSPYGRFLHITDLHPDTFYKHGSAVSSGCHHNKPKKKKKDGRWRAGWWGTGVSDCDSPPRLVTSSLKWISQNWLPAHPQAGSTSSIDDGPPRGNGSTAGQGFDFILWTGDSARHDIDDKVPRTLAEIFDLNRWTLDQIQSAFPGVPVVPSLGNNDIFPHNILFPGPNRITKEFVRIWADHIPEYEFHTFEQGGYYVKELLPNRLAAMSLNTLYFYDSNKAVDGCAKTNRGRHGRGGGGGGGGGDSDVDPGTAQLDWLEVQLDLLRRRKMQAHILGHVPPTAGNYFPRCYRRYTDIVLRYQDTVVGQHFGHMNTDAFFVQEDQEALYAAGAAEAEETGMGDAVAPSSLASGGIIDDDDDGDATIMGDDGDDDGGATIMGDDGLPADLRQDYSSLPGKARTNDDYYSFFFTAPSIIPTYYPSFRVWTYNTTEAERYDDWRRGEDDEDEEDEEDDDGIDIASRRHHRPLPDRDGKHKKKHGKKKKKKRHGKERPRHVSPDSPSRRNTYLSLLGYSQWVMDIDEQNEHVERILDGTANSTSTVQPLKGGSGGGGKHDGHEDEEERRRQRRRRRHEAEKVEVDFRLEYTTYTPSTLWQEIVRPRGGGGGGGAGAGSELGPVPVPRHLLELELDRLGVHPSALATSTEGQEDDDVDEGEGAGDAGGSLTRVRKWKPPKALRKFTDYSLPAITVDSMMDLARRLVVDKKLWKRFVRRIYAESGVKGKK
ncbi:related to PPN1 - vacuolar endopolyphosphatase [Pseudozyma flocculosa]|uniref:Related to PPN1 - vacuolar endopolyphosphatase n=1 Tax=Pseudozyma flocculosa TaxID=84751 RepID=A0A5C3F187_9BASI|nr:related to PPN1 - vacuolar endopolyphosphatase [Pseudozyma flocculosa]